ncbi:MAG: MBL fold metallo-hydrolase, partial [Armatimonadota bacterium]
VGVWRGEALYLLDAGEGVAGQFARLAIPPDALRAIFISHMHADHTGGLPVLMQWLQLNKRKRRLDICLPSEGMDGVQNLLTMHYLLPEWLGFDLELLAVEEGPGYEAEGVSVEAIPNRHLEGFVARLKEAGDPRLGESFSYAAEVDGKRILFTADLAHPSEVPERLRDADLAIVELAHYTPEELGEVLGGLPLPRLVVTHLIHTLEPVEGEIPARIRAAGYEGEVLVAHDGDEFEV